ncbi:MAG: Uma2 family endonuclease [Anaerolineae bacterium]|nr:Uma2 family endonuclease [Anaerolineae bacterium]
MRTLVTPTDALSVYGPPQGHWTAQDWETLPDDGNRYEIIDGVLYMSTSPSYFHQWILKQFVIRWGAKVEDSGLGYVHFAPVGVLMPGCEPVQPDLVFIRAGRESIIHDRRIRGVPDLIAEILSPGNRDYDEDIKKAAYERAGVPEYAVIDPDQRRLKLFRLDAQRRYGDALVFGADQTVTFQAAPSVPLRIAELFAGSPDTTP